MTRMPVRRAYYVAFCAATLLSVGLATAAPGDFDLSFGQGGLFQLTGLPLASSDGQAHAVAVDSGGYLLAVGSVNAAKNGVLARLTPAGSLDASLAGKGYLLDGSVFSAWTGSLAVPVPDAKALWVETATTPCWFADPRTCGLAYYPYYLLARRIGSDGATDLTYGMVYPTTPTPGSFNLSVLPNLNLGDGDVASQPDGSLIAIGTAHTTSLVPDRLAMARVDPSGQKDPLFAQNAGAAIDCGAQYSSLPNPAKLARLPAGQTLVARQVTNATTQAFDLCVARLNQDGTLDPAFGNAGRTIVSSPLVATRYPFEAMVRSDGAIAILMLDARPGQPNQPVMVWLQANGAPDTTGGRAAVDNLGGALPASVTAATLQPDDKILVAGFASTGSGAAAAVDPAQPMISRVDPRGKATDPTFGANHGGYASLVTNGTRLVPNALLAGAGAVIYVAGGAGPANPGATTQFAVAKLQGDPPPGPPPAANTSTGGGGCFSTRNGPLDPTLPALLLAATGYLVSRRRSAAKRYFPSSRARSAGGRSVS